MKKHHKNCVADSKENYKWDLRSERINSHRDSLHNVEIEQAPETRKNELGIGWSALLDAAEFGMVYSCSFTVYFKFLRQEC